MPLPTDGFLQSTREAPEFHLWLGPPPSVPQTVVHTAYVTLANVGLLARAELGLDEGGSIASDGSAPPHLTCLPPSSDPSTTELTLELSGKIGLI